MKKFLRVFIPIILAVAIILCTAWYLFVYDRAFTRDMLLSIARHSENQGNHSVAAWFYNVAYAQSGNSDEVAIELAQQYKNSGNYTKAEYTLSNAIADGGGLELYIALCNTYVEQDKLLDAVTMLDSITNPQIKEQIAQLRPSAPAADPAPGFYSQYISVTLTSETGAVYASPYGKYPNADGSPCTTPIALADGENTIYALSIADNGLVSPLSIYGYTIGGVIQLVEFADPVIESAIRATLNVADDKELYTNDLWTIKSFDIPKEATNYSDLRHMNFLEQITVVDGRSNDFSFLASLANINELIIKNTNVSQDSLKTIANLPLLKRLTLSNCGLSSIAPLANATGLVYLDLNNNTIRNIDSLSPLQSLQELNLQHNAVVDLSALSTLTKLTKLDVSYNALTTLSPISRLSGLTWLNASVNSIAELGNIGNLSALTYLSLQSNQIANLSTLSSCTAITELNIGSNSLTDISSLSSLINLMYFDFSYNQVKTIPAFPKSCNLVSINGSHNLISSLDALSGLLHLNHVYMDYNASISSIKALQNCPVLVQVNVYGTKVTKVSTLTDQGVIVNYKPV